MSKTEFANKIIEKLDDAIGQDGTVFSSATPALAMQAISDGITEYIIANTKVVISYQGIIPGTPPVTDPLVADTFKVAGMCTPPGASNDFNSWIKQIETNIIAGFTLAASGKAGIAFVAPQIPFTNIVGGILTTQGLLKSAYAKKPSNPQLSCWEIICDGIINWINTTAMNTTPGAAAHKEVSSAGTGTITKITIS